MTLEVYRDIIFPETDTPSCEPRFTMLQQYGEPRSTLEAVFTMLLSNSREIGVSPWLDRLSIRFPPPSSIMPVV